MKETYKAKLPQRFRVGDPCYYQLDSKDSKTLNDMIVDITPPEHFVARIVLLEEPYELYPYM